MSPGKSTDGNQHAAAPDVTLAHRVCAELAERARHQLATHGHFQRRIEAFTFEVLGDTLVVRGSVPSFYLKQWCRPCSAISTEPAGSITKST